MEGVGGRLVDALKLEAGRVHLGDTVGRRGVVGGRWVAQIALHRRVGGSLA